MDTNEQHPAFLRARRSLILDHPFFASLVLYLEPKQDPSCKVAWVDGKTLGYNPTAFEALAPKEAAGVLAKMVLHCALEHHLRREERDDTVWKRACDYVTSPIVRDSGLPLPQGTPEDAQHAKGFAEEVYRALQETQQKQQPNASSSSSSSTGVGQKQQQNQSPSQTAPQTAQNALQAAQAPSTSAGTPQGQKTAPAQGSQAGAGESAGGEVRDMPGGEGQSTASPAEQSANGQEWKVAMQQALNNAKSQGTLPAGLERHIVKALEPRTSWKELMRRFFTAVARDDLSWMRPNRRYMPQGIYLPSLRSERMGEMVVAVDTSGSIGAHQLSQFAAEINAIAEDVRPERVHIVYCDAAVGKVEEYTEDDMPLKLTPCGGGGTAFAPVFDWVEQQGLEPACLVYLTDMYGSFPKLEPSYPVLWAATSDREGPFGETVHITENSK